MKNCIALVLMISSMLCQEAFAWGMTGHRAIAEIAERHLTKKAKKNIHRLIGKEKLAYWANWADYIKSDPDKLLNSTGSWHFINTDANLSFEDFNKELQLSPDNNLYKSFLRIKKSAKEDKTLSLQEQRYNLYYLIHIFGDAHQPLHVSRAEDLGGNRIEVSLFGRKTNIHQVWDSGLIDNDKYSFLEYAYVLDIHDKKYYQTFDQASFEEVLYESHQLADKIYADVAYNANLGYEYLYNNRKIVEQCLLKAGIRLARQLNEIYG